MGKRGEKRGGGRGRKGGQRGVGGGKELKVGVYRYSTNEHVQSVGVFLTSHEPGLDEVLIEAVPQRTK